MPDAFSGTEVTPVVALPLPPDGDGGSSKRGDDGGGDQLSASETAMMDRLTACNLCRRGQAVTSARVWEIGTRRERERRKGRKREGTGPVLRLGRNE